MKMTSSDAIKQMIKPDSALCYRSIWFDRKEKLFKHTINKRNKKNERKKERKRERKRTQTYSFCFWQRDFTRARNLCNVSHAYMLKKERMLLFEDLPDELLLEIFAYLSPGNIYLSFANLNNRFDSILSDSSVPLGIQVTNQNINDVNNYISYFTHLNICCDDIDIHQFPFIRSLTLGPNPRPHDDLISQLVDDPEKYFPFLQQLIIYPPAATWYSGPAVRLWTLLFTNQFPSCLKRCTLVGRIFANPIRAYFCRSLRSLSIGGCSLRDLPTLLVALPNLRYLNTELWGVTDTMHILDYYHSKLTHFHIKFAQETIVLKELESLLIYVPYLERLTVDGARRHEIFDAECWHQILSTQLKYLRTFSCTIRLAETHSNRQMNIDFVRQCSPLFSRMRLFYQNDWLFISNQK